MKFLSTLFLAFSLFTSVHADTLTLSMDTIIGISGEQAEISITANGFTDLAVLEGTIEWDSLGLSLVEVKDFGVANLSKDNFGRPNGVLNKLTFTWTEPSDEGLSVPDGTVIFKLLFNVIGTSKDTAIIHFADTPLNVTAANNLLDPVTVIEQNGQVSLFPALQVSVSDSDVSCFGNNDGSILLSATGANGDYKYLWGAGETVSELTNLTVGTYFFTVTDETLGLELRDSIVISGPDELLITLADITEENDTLASLSATVQGGTAPYSFTWSDTSIINDPVGLPNGTYGITVTDNNGCVATDSITIVIKLPSSLTDIERSFVRIHPNPTTGLINVDLTSFELGHLAKWQIFNSLGQLTNAGNTKHQGILRIDMSTNTPGLYYFKYRKQSFPIILLE